MRRSLFALAFAAFFVVPVRADEVANLVTLARVWSAVKFLDPAMATTDIDWDAALVHAIPKVRAAKSDDELAAAIGGMLAELHDHASRVARAPRPTPAADLAAVDLTRTDGEDVLILNVGPFAAKNGWAQASAELRKLTPQTMKKNLVIDLRTGGDEELAENELSFFEQMSPVASALDAPAKRYAFHSGYAPQTGGTSGGYYSGILDVPGRNFQPVKNAPERVAFVTDRITGVPEVALALHDAGRALIASTEPLGDEIAAISTAIALPAGWRAEYRIAQLAGSSIATDLVDPDPVMTSVAALRKSSLPAEHTGLFFEQASGTKFIGSPSAGANGDVTAMILPGGIVVSFTGHDVRHADGRQLQRIGLPLEIEITPTMAGIRAGRDEVLDRAIQYVNATVH